MSYETKKIFFSQEEKGTFMANVLFGHYKQHLMVGVCIHTCMFLCVMIHSESLKSHGQVVLPPSFSPQHVITQFLEMCQVLRYLYSSYSFITNTWLTAND